MSEETKEEKKVIKEAKKISDEHKNNEVSEKPKYTIEEMTAKREALKKANDDYEAEKLRAEKLRAEEMNGGRSYAGSKESTEEDKQKEIDAEAKRYVEQWT